MDRKKVAKISSIKESTDYYSYLIESKILTPQKNHNGTWSNKPDQDFAQKVSASDPSCLLEVNCKFSSLSPNIWLQKAKKISCKKRKLGFCFYSSYILGWKGHLQLSTDCKRKRRNKCQHFVCLDMGDNQEQNSPPNSNGIPDFIASSMKDSSNKPEEKIGSPGAAVWE